jgi:UDP-N-acetylglucosamine 2-epimerase (non-hydrolysing)
MAAAIRPPSARADSGGVQEEACVLGVPCVTLRDNTERPETVEIGANMVAGTEPNSILAAVDKMIDKRGGWSNPFGDGHAAEKIVDIILRQC